jgi:hypothetical protein
MAFCFPFGLRPQDSFAGSWRGVSRMSRKLFVAVVVLSAAFCWGEKAFGQATGSFFGSVTDKSGSAIAGVKLRVTSQATGVARDTVTDDTGHYIINLLPVSTYTVHVEFKGFQPAESKDVKLQVDEQRELNFALSPATVTSSVEVVASEVAVETTNPSLGQVITSQQVAQLPLNGRDFVQLATLTPGTTQETSPSFFNGGPSSEVSARGSISLSVGGSRANSTDWLLDGNDNNELTAGGIAILSSIDSIQEFKVLTYNYSAEFGTRAGPTVLLTTKSGANQFHGALFEFLRNTSLDAKSFFATSTEKFNLNQFGGAIGGPLRKNKTFFFIDGEQKYQRRGTPFQGIVPTDAMRAGDYSSNVYGTPIPIGTMVIANPYVFGTTGDPYFQCQGSASGPAMPVNADGSQPKGVDCNKIPGANPLNAAAFPNGLINPIGQSMINLFPHANASNPGLGYNFQSQPVRELDETKFDIRLDHNFSNSDSLFARFSYDQASSYVPGGAPGFAEQGAFASNQGIVNHARNVSIGETHIFSSTDVNQFNLGYNRIFNYITSTGTGTCESTKLGIPGANLGCTGSGSTQTCAGSSCGLTSTQLSGGYWSLGDRGYSPFQGGTNVFTISDSFDMIRGKHDIHIGAAIRNNQMNVRAVGFQDGYWVVSGAWTSNGFALPGDASADALMGLSSIRIHDQNFNGDITGRRWLIFRPFIQDDWRLNKDLTLNLGLGWSMATPVTESKGRMANFIPSTGSLIVSGSGGVAMDWTALEPRVGLAWKIFGSEKTALRAGYGMFHDAAWNMGAQGLWQNPPFAAESFAAVFGGCTTATAYCALHGGTPNVGTGAMIGFSDGFPSITSPPTPATFAGSFNNENTDLKQGRVQQFNVNVERQLPGQIVLTAGYAGSRSSHILNFGNNMNVSSPTACGTVSGYTLGCGPGGASIPTPYPDFFTIYSINDYGRAHYNSFQVKAETKSSKYGIYALIGYTYSQTYDTGYADGLSTPIGQPYFPLYNWQNLDWARSQINLNHNFTASVIYDLPFGTGKKFGHDWNSATNALLGNWQVTVIEKITSGFPIFIVDSAPNSGASLINIGNAVPYGRPDQVCNPGSGFTQSLNEWFNTSCFPAPTAGKLGDANRAPSTGPDFVNTDFSVIKRFALPWESMGLDFRAEIFNLFNHAQFGLPGTPGLASDIRASNFGKISSTVNNPRLVQFGLKFTF